MKKYEQPAIELIKFSMMEVLTSSEEPQNNNDWDGEFEPYNPGAAL